MGAGGYYANDRLRSIAIPAFNVQYGRDAMGNIITTSSNNALSGYLYDRLYRLTQVEDGNVNPLETYTYSKAGDHKSKTANGLATGTYGYTNHWLTSTGSEARTYDAAGNTTSNQVGGNTYNYTYNLNNQRLSKTVGGNTDRYVYNEQSQLLGETGSLRRDYLWLDDLPIGVVDNGSTLNYVIADALNTPRVITDNSGATAWYWPIENNAFGEQQPIGSFTYNLRFPGQYYDAESGLFYNVHRYYDPLTGRYVQSDPLGLLAGVNTYGYVRGNPIERIDPLGLWQVTATVTLSPFAIGPGGTLTFGYNHGQFNIGGWLGGSAGDSVSINPNDLPCHDPGSFRSTRADGKIGILSGLFSTNFSAQYGPQVNSAEFTTGIPFVKSLEAGVSIEDGKLSPTPIASGVIGGSAFLGYGAQWYW